jgi:hypothetical protein
MKKTIYVVTAVALASVILISLAVFNSAPPTQNTRQFYDFESGFEGWVADSHLPEDPNRPGELVDWKIELAHNKSFSGTKSALFYIDGLQDDGTIWIERKLTVAPNTVTNVNVTFQFWSETESWNTLAVIVGYVGIRNPEVEEDFEILGEANDAEGWRAYNLINEVQTDDSGELYVALGISVRWETHLTYFIDDISITII